MNERDGRAPAGCPAAEADLRDFIRAWDAREEANRRRWEAIDRLEAAEDRALAVFSANGLPPQINDYDGTIRLDYWDGQPHLQVIRPLWSHELKPLPPGDAEVDEAAAFAALEDCGFAPPDADALATILAAGLTTAAPDGPRPDENGGPT